jgi:hypothetical protein
VTLEPQAIWVLPAAHWMSRLPRLPQVAMTSGHLAPASSAVVAP